MVPRRQGACWALGVLPAVTGSGPRLTRQPDGPANVAPAALAAKVICMVHVEVSVLTRGAQLAADAGFAETLPIALLTFCDSTDGALGITLAACASIRVIGSQVPVQWFAPVTSWTFDICPTRTGTRRQGRVCSC